MRRAEAWARENCGSYSMSDGKINISTLALERLLEEHAKLLRTIDAQEAEIENAQKMTGWYRIAVDLIRQGASRALSGTDWRHKKTGNVYQVIGGCRIEATNKLGILYAREGVVWCQPSEEFLDGKFEAL
jgi:hypothetical protein